MGKARIRSFEGGFKRTKPDLRAVVHIPQDLPITQNEIEVMAALLDDWDITLPEAAEAAE
jgi:hypothetical protein